MPTVNYDVCLRGAHPAQATTVITHTASQNQCLLKPASVCRPAESQLRAPGQTTLPGPRRILSDC